MKNKTTQNSIITLTFLSVIIFIITYSLVYNLSIRGSDYTAHIFFANTLTFKNFFSSPVASNPIWHILTRTLSKIFSISMENSAAAVVAFFKVATYIVIYKALCYLTNNSISKIFSSVISFMLIIVEPLYVPWFSKSIYLGQWSPNVWHSPTNIAVIPFGILIFILFIKLYNEHLSNNIKNQNLRFCTISILLLISTFVKPSFAQVFIPAITLFSIIEFFINKRKNLTFHLKTAIAILPTCITMVLQILLVFNAKTSISSVEFCFFDVWRNYSKNIFFSTIISLAFPLYVLVINYKSIIKNKALFFSVIAVFTGWIEFACLAETGARKFDANFSWAYMVAMNLLWLVSTSVFINNQYNSKEFNRKTKLFSIIGYALFFLHLLTGILYLKQFFFNKIWL